MSEEDCEKARMALESIRYSLLSDVFSGDYCTLKEFIRKAELSLKKDVKPLAALLKK